MPLLVYNLTTTSVTLVGVDAPTLPASTKAGERGPTVDVTSELHGLTSVQYVALEKQRIGTLDYDWSGEPEYKTSALRTQKGLGQEASTRRTRKATKQQKRGEKTRRCMEDALNGDMVLSLIPTGPLSRPAANFNGAAAGALTDRVIVTFKNAGGTNQYWSKFALTVQPAEAVADLEVGAPTIDPTTVNLKMGRAEFVVIYDTDAGATKTYVAGDSVSVVVRVAADDKLLGWTVSAQTLTINVT